MPRLSSHFVTHLTGNSYHGPTRFVESWRMQCRVFREEHAAVSGRGASG